jgi:methionine aminotransferase
MQPKTKLPKVGTTIFTVMSQLAMEHKAVNLGQGFPDFPVPDRLVESLDRAMRAGHNQYAPMTGIPALRQAIANKTERVYGWRPDADTEVTVTSGASSSSTRATTATNRRSNWPKPRRCTSRSIRRPSRRTGRRCAPRSPRARAC